MGNAQEDINPYAPYARDAEAGSGDSQEKLIVKPIKTWKGYIWDTWELPKDQRWLLFKLDAFVLTFASVSTPLMLLPLFEYTDSSSPDRVFSQKPRSVQHQQCLP